jgi:hypothetical protein
VHAKLVAFIGEALQPRLPSPLRARSEERVVIESNDPAGTSISSYRSDVAIVDSRTRERAATPAPALAGAATLDPVIVKFYRDPIVDRFIHIIDTSTGNRVVTAIEVLSPANKGPGRPNKDYLQKLADYDDAGVNLVEIDLLREPGRGRMRVQNEDLPTNRRAPYMICIQEARDPNRWLVYPIPLRAPLPSIPIPLRPTDKPVQLDLQPLLDRVYTAGGHDDIDYTKPPVPPLDPEDAAWAKELLGKLSNR